MREKLSKEKILETALELIDEKGGYSEVNFREIARRLGCAHTSLYHFYESYPRLLLAALEEIRRRMSAEVLRDKDNREEPNHFLRHVSALVDFNLRHKGWYRFLWMDSHPLSMEEIVSMDERPERIFITELTALSHGRLDEVSAGRLLGILHAYFHGEFVKFLGGRSAIGEEKDLKRILMENLRFMYETLVKELV